MRFLGASFNTQEALKNMASKTNQNSAALSDDEKKIARQKEKAEKFKELATQRVTTALAKMERVAALSNRKQYAYDSEQVAKVVGALRKMVDRIEKNFATGAERVSDFSL